MISSRDRPRRPRIMTSRVGRRGDPPAFVRSSRRPSGRARATTEGDVPHTPPPQPVDNAWGQRCGRIREVTGRVTTGEAAPHRIVPNRWAKPGDDVGTTGGGAWGPVVHTAGFHSPAPWSTPVTHRFTTYRWRRSPATTRVLHRIHTTDDDDGISLRRKKKQSSRGGQRAGQASLPGSVGTGGADALRCDEHPPGDEHARTDQYPPTSGSNQPPGPTRTNPNRPGPTPGRHPGRPRSPADDRRDDPDRRPSDRRLRGRHRDEVPCRA